MGSHTGDVEVEDVIFLDYVVDELLAIFVHNEYLPLGGSLARYGRREGLRTSPRVVCLIDVRMTAEEVSMDILKKVIILNIRSR